MKLTRRALVGAGTSLAAVAASIATLAQARAANEQAAPATPGPSPWRRFRRIVTSEDASGRTIVIADGEPANQLVLNGTRITRLWESGAVPVGLPLAADAGLTAGNAYREGFRGTSFYLAEIPPGIGADDIPLHRSPSLDYMAILAGRIALLTDNGELELAPGDVIVQGGNLHTWANRWTETCVLLFVVVAAER